MTKRLLRIAIFLSLAIAMIGVGTRTQAVVAQAPKVILYNSNASDPAPRKFDDEIVKMWNDAHPDMQIQHSVINHEDFKQAIRAYVVAEPAPDVLTWFG